jgi:hypothetical protein
MASARTGSPCSTPLPSGRSATKAKWQVRIDPESLFLPTVAGLLGADVMANYDIEFDFYGGKMNLFAPISCPNTCLLAPAYSELPIKFDINAISLSTRP